MAGSSSRTTNNEQRTTTIGRRLAPLAVLGLLAGQAEAQAPAPDAPQATEPLVSSTPAKLAPLVDLANRYRLSERYAKDGDPDSPALIGPYRMGIVEVLKDSVDSPQGAPRRSESTRQVIFVERPAEAEAGVGPVGATVRAFERFRLRPEDPARTMGPRPLEGLAAYVRARPNDPALVLSLTENRKLTEYEFEVISREVFAPQVASVLPGQAIRVGDSWRIPRRGAQGLLGEPGIQGDTLIGKFAELKKEADGPRRVAVIAITGRVAAPSGEVAVNAEALFTFVPEDRKAVVQTEGVAVAPRPGDEVIEARGAITELRLARVTSGALPGPGRLRYQSSRELTVQRQLGLPPGAPGLPFPKFETPPTVADDNAWLTLIEPSGRFSIRHPQDLLPPDRAQLAPAIPNKVALFRARRDGFDVLQVEFTPKALAPEALKERLAAEYGKAAKMEIIKGSEEFLPEAEWPRLRVYRIDAAAKLPDRGGNPSASPRTHFDAYLLQSGQNASVIAIATTTRDAVTAYRREVEKILKTVEFQPGKPPAE